MRKAGHTEIANEGDTSVTRTTNIKTKAKARTKNETKRSKAGSTELGAALIEALSEAVAFQAGEKTGATVRIVSVRRAKAALAPRFLKRDIAKLRKQLRLSQPLFANALNVSPAAVKAWEQGQNEPSGAAVRLLQIAETHPEIILETLRAR